MTNMQDILDKARAAIAMRERWLDQASPTERHLASAHAKLECHAATIEQMVQALMEADKALRLCYELIARDYCEPDQSIGHVVESSVSKEWNSVCNAIGSIAALDEVK